MSYHLQWIKQQASFNTTDDDDAPFIAIGTDHNIYVTYVTYGSTSGNSYTGTFDIVVFKLNGITGDTMWVRQNASFNTTDSNLRPSIIVDHQNNVFVAYYSTGTASGQSKTGQADIIIFKMDTDGTLLWIKQNNTFNTTQNDVEPNITVDKDDNICLVYRTSGVSSGQTLVGNFDIVVVKLDNNGNTLWVKQQPSFDTSLADYSPAVASNTNGDFFITYYTQGTASGQTNTGGMDVVVFKMDTDGNTLWIRQQPSFNTTADDYNGSSISIDQNGNCLIAYWTNNGIASGQTNTGGNDIVIIKLDTNGNTLWVSQQPTFNASSNNQYPSIVTDLNNYIYVNYVTTGIASGQTNTGGTDVVICCLSPTGQTVWVSQSSSWNTSSPNQKYYQSSNICIDDNMSLYNVYYTLGSASGQSNIGSTDIVVFKLMRDQPACFNKGTKLLCLTSIDPVIESYLPIETLKVGNLIKTYKHGYRRIVMIDHNHMINNPKDCMHCMYTIDVDKRHELSKYIHNISDIIMEPLTITGAHSILIDNYGMLSVDENKRNHVHWGNKKFMVDDKYLLMSCVCDLFKPYDNTDHYTYYHLVLDDDGDENKRYGIWANGILSETQCRNHFKQQKWLTE